MTGNTAAYLALNIIFVYIVFRFFTCFWGEFHGRRLFLVGSCVVFYITNSGLNLLFHCPPVNLLTSLAGMGLISLNYKIDMRRRLFTIALVYIMIMLTEVFVTVGFLHYIPGMALPAAANAVVYLFLFIIELLTERFFTLRQIQKTPLLHWMALMAVPVGSMVIIYLITMNSYADTVGNRLIIVILLFMNAMVFYLYDAIQNSYLQKMRRNFAEMQTAAYARQMELMVHSQERIHRIQHDLKHHITALHALTEQQDNMAVHAYLHTLEQNLQDAGNTHYCSNPTINSLLNCMLQDTEAKLNQLDIDVQFPASLSANLFDISIVLGNLLDNAIRAALASKEKTLQLSMKSERGVFLLVIKNSYQEEPVFCGAFPRSTKQSDTAHPHGIGLSSVNEVVSRYHGEFTSYCREGLFCTEVILYTPSEPILSPPSQ